MHQQSNMLHSTGKLSGTMWYISNLHKPQMTVRRNACRCRITVGLMNSLRILSPFKTNMWAKYVCHVILCLVSHRAYRRPYWGKPSWTCIRNDAYLLAAECVSYKMCKGSTCSLLSPLSAYSPTLNCDVWSSACSFTNIKWRMPKEFWIPKMEPLHHVAAKTTNQP